MGGASSQSATDSSSRCSVSTARAGAPGAGRSVSGQGGRSSPGGRARRLLPGPQWTPFGVCAWRETDGGQRETGDSDGERDRETGNSGVSFRLQRQVTAMVSLQSKGWFLPTYTAKWSPHRSHLPPPAHVAARGRWARDVPPAAFQAQRCSPRSLGCMIPDFPTSVLEACAVDDTPAPSHPLLLCFCGSGCFRGHV